MNQVRNMDYIAEYMEYITTQKRYSGRTVEIYSSVIGDFLSYVSDDGSGIATFGDEEAVSALNRNVIRAWQMHLMDEKKNSPRTVNLCLSVLSGLCRYLVKRGVLKSNPVSLVTRPKQAKRIPVFYREDAMRDYMDTENALSRRDFELDFRTEQERKDTYRLCLQRMIVSLLYCTGIRRAELIDLKVGDVDLKAGKMRVHGKGDKMREIPLISSIIEEMSLYLQSVERLTCCKDRDGSSRLLVTYGGGALYPVLVDRAVKAELGSSGNAFAGRKSPHVLRHTLATGLMEEGADLNSIKEVLGHASLAATQVYTHSSARQLKKIYESAHPRAGKMPGEATNKGGNYGN